MKVPFPNIAEVFLIFWEYFLECFLFSVTNMKTLTLNWDVSHRMGSFVTLRYSIIEVPFLSISWFPLIVCYFFQIILICLRYFNYFPIVRLVFVWCVSHWVELWRIFYTFSIKQVHICIIFNTLPRAITKCLQKKYTIIFFKRIDSNAW